VNRSIEQVLDTCLAQLNSGADLEAVLEAHPELADELRPLLAAAALVQLDVPPPVRREENKAKLLAAVAARRRAVEAADGYVNEVRAGVPLAELVADAPDEMKPVVWAAWRMCATPFPRPSAGVVSEGKRRLMAMAAGYRSERSARAVDRWRQLERLQSAADSVLSGLLHSRSASRRAWSGAVGLAAAVVLFVGLTGLGTATAGSLPGEPFYGVKRLGENARLLFAFDPADRADLSLRYGERRLDEMRRLAEEGRPVPLELVEAWLRGHVDALDEVRKLPLDEQLRLAEACLAAVAERAEIEGRLRQEAPDPVRLEALLAWARALAESAREPDEPVPVPDGTEVAEPPFISAPLPLPRPLPPEDVAASDSRDEMSDVPVAQPVVEPPVWDEAADRAEAPPMVQPGNETAGEDREEQKDEQPAAEPVPTEPPAAEPSPPAPPPYVQPPMDAPTPEPTTQPEPEPTTQPEDVPEG
jgi:hypothetical protein